MLFVNNPRFVLQERFSVCLDQVTSAIGICVGLRAMVHWEIGFTSCEQDTSKWILTLQIRCGLLPSCSTEIDDNRCVMCVCVSVWQSFNALLTWVSGLLSWTVLIYEAIAAIWLFGRLEDFSGFQLNSAHRTAVCRSIGAPWCPTVKTLGPKESQWHVEDMALNARRPTLRLRRARAHARPSF